MNSHGLHRIFWGLFLIAFSMLPFELPVAEALHAIVFPYVGIAYTLFFIGTLVVVSAAATMLTGHYDYRRLFSRELRDYIGYATLFVLLGIYTFIVTLLHNASWNPLFVENSARQLVLGYIAPALAILLLFLVDEPKRRFAWRCFYSGYAAFLAISILFLLSSYRAAAVEAPWYAALNPGQRLFMWRFTFAEPWNLYSQYIGNSNKTSNNILFFLLFSTRFLGQADVQERGPVRRILFVFWALGTITLFALFSRAALLLFPLVVYGSGILRLTPRRVKLAIAGSFAGVLVLGIASFKAAISYLLISRGADDQVAGFFGTYETRVRQWAWVKDYLITRNDVFFSGLGTSKFSWIFYGDPVMGTHNTFLDTFLEAGVVGLILLIAIMLLLVLRTIDVSKLRIHHPFGLLAVLIMLALMTREFSFAYLYATSLGGLCLCALFMTLSDSRFRRVRP